MRARRASRVAPTRAQLRYLKALVRLARPWRPLTVRELASAADRSLPVTHAALVRLKKRGLVTWIGGARRTLQPTPDALTLVMGPQGITDPRAVTLLPRHRCRKCQAVRFGVPKCPLCTDGVLH